MTVYKEPKDPSNKHFWISMIKSGVRIVGCIIALLTGSVAWLAGGFLIAEILGIAEEL
jgi:hypothetical protein